MNLSIIVHVFPLGDGMRKLRVHIRIVKTTLIPVAIAMYKGRKRVQLCGRFSTFELFIVAGAILRCTQRAAQDYKSNPYGRAHGLTPVEQNSGSAAQTAGL